VLISIHDAKSKEDLRISSSPDATGHSYRKLGCDRILAVLSPVGFYRELLTTGSRIDVDVDLFEPELAEAWKP